jgi:hypothetical protein
MTNQIKFFMAEELHNQMEDQAVAILGEKIENDKLFTFEDMAFFYKVENEKEILVKYPELNETIGAHSDSLDTYLRWQCESEEDVEVANGLITIDEQAIFENMKEMTETTEFGEEFMNNPSETLKKLRKETVDFLTSTKIGDIIRLAKKEGLNIDMGHVEVVARG